VQACTVHGAGDLRVQDWAETAPGAGQISVDVRLGGICGSDLHYYHRGGVGDFMVVEPMVLGHEVVGVVEQLGDGVAGPPPGTRVAIHPATVCGQCRECRDRRPNVCRNTRYLGSAARTPHVQGGFSERTSVPAGQVRLIPDGMAWERAVLAEPLSVALHGAGRAGDVAGRRVLVTGAGPIGCLVVAVLRHAEVAEVVVVDLLDEALAVASAVGASRTVRADAEDPAAAVGMPHDVDVAIEASGSPAGLATCLQGVRPGGTVVMLGLAPPGDVPFSGDLGNLTVTKEITVVGSFRFGAEFDRALELLEAGLHVDPVVTATYPLSDARAAFDLASDRRRACKVLLDLTST